MFHQVAADTRKRMHDGDPKGGKIAGISDPAALEERRTVNRSAGDDRFPRAQRLASSRAADFRTDRAAILEHQPLSLSQGADLEICAPSRLRREIRQRSRDAPPSITQRQ